MPYFLIRFFKKQHSKNAGEFHGQVRHIQCGKAQWFRDKDKLDKFVLTHKNKCNA